VSTGVIVALIVVFVLVIAASSRGPRVTTIERTTRRDENSTGGNE
jgi:hypothetical protein